jgi:MFS family permease
VTRSAHPRIALLLLTLLNLVNYVDRSVLFAVQPLVQSEFHLSDAQMGYVGSAFFIFYMCAAPLMGPLADRYSRRSIMFWGALLWSAATFLTAFTQSFSTLLIRHTLVGVGEASFVTISPTFLADIFPEQKRGQVLGWFYLAIPVGTALGYLVGGELGSGYGWRVPFYVAGVPGFLLAFLLLFLKEPTRGQFDTTRETVERTTFTGLVRNPAFWTATIGMAAMTFALGGLQVWMPTFLHRVRGYSLSRANLVFGLSTAFDGMTASLAGGWLGDRLLRRTRASYYLVSAASLGVALPAMWIALYTSGGRMLAGIVAAEFLLLLNTAPLNAAVINSVGAKIRASAIALNIFLIHLLGDAPSPWLIGYVSDHYSLGVAFLLPMFGIALSSAILFYGMKFAPEVRAPASPAESLRAREQ